MREPSAPSTYRFGEIEVDVSAYEVRRSGRRILLARQPMELLLLLLERRQELVTREDIARRLWSPDIFTDTDAGIRTAVLRIRQALDAGASPGCVETVIGKGYRFIAPVEVAAPSPAAPSPDPAASPAEPPNPARHNLPPDLTSFVGRRTDLLELPDLLASSRLLSLTGSGGVGKTRLALRLARDAMDRFPGGVWLVDLGPLTAPDLIVHAVASALGVHESRGRSVRQALLDAIRGRIILLLLDNCEHLIGPCAALAEVLLLGAPGLTLLATSREALRVPGETVYRVPSLTTPDLAESVSPELLARSEAGQLFVQRAHAVDGTFSVTEENADATARICGRLDGIPLAIELAAACVGVMSPKQIESRLQDRFRLLSRGPRTTVARQRTLEATVEWSYRLLSEAERQVLMRLSVFPSTWTLEAAEQVCAGDGIGESEVLGLLLRLASKSLVFVEPDVDGECRYRFLETIRQYGRERLMEAGTVDHFRQRHFTYFTEEFRGVRPILRGFGQIPCLRRLRLEQDNVRSALEWGLSSSPAADTALELAAALFWFWTKCGQFEEGRLWLARALAPAAQADGAVRARLLIGLAHMDYFQGHHPAVAERAAEALGLGRACADGWVISVALFLDALTAFERGDHEHAAARAIEARMAADASGDAIEHGGPAQLLAAIALAANDFDRAQQLYDESLEVHRLAGDTWGQSMVLVTSAALRIARGDLECARAEAREALSLSQQLEDPRGIAWSLDVFAGLLAASDCRESAARLWGASDALLERVGGALMPPLRWIRDRYLGPVRQALGDRAFEIAHGAGRAMPLAEAIALALGRPVGSAEDLVSSPQIPPNAPAMER